MYIHIYTRTFRNDIHKIHIYLRMKKTIELKAMQLVLIINLLNAKKTFNRIIYSSAKMKHLPRGRTDCQCEHFQRIPHLGRIHPSPGDYLSTRYTLAPRAAGPELQTIIIVILHFCVGGNLNNIHYKAYT